MENPLWNPSQDRIAQSNLARFIQQVQSYRPCVINYPTLYQWSIDQPEEFWGEVWHFCGVEGEGPGNPLVLNLEKMPGATWFPNAKLNFAQNLLLGPGDQEALVFWNELGRQRSLTFDLLREEVAQVAEGLKKAGVKPGDRVAAFLPNISETVIAMLAAASLGAIFSSTSPDFGTQGVLDRFGQIEPVVLFAADGYIYNGKQHDCLKRVGEIVQQVPSIRKTVIVGYLDSRPNLTSLPNAVQWNDFHCTGQPLQCPLFPFNHPLFILYSSGTTGPPKCIVHGAGGTLIQHLKEHILNSDIKPGDRFFYFTTCGWMMWNWLVSGLASGATVVLYDGSPLANEGRILWDVAQHERVAVFGASAKYFSLLEKNALQPRITHQLNSLRTVLSTGSPLAPECFDFIYQNVKADVCLSSISGGTDIVSCFAGGNPIGPVYKGELQALGLGMKVEVFNEKGESVQGEKGELVCTAPFPSIPLGFWNDPQGDKFHSAYFNHYANVWRHGDWAVKTPSGGMIIYGRSDAVLNPGGVRIGTAEIYRLVEQVDEILESIVVGQNWQGDVRVILFVKLRPGLQLDQTLKEKIKKQIRNNATPRHVPAKIIQVADIPRTLSGKIVELAVRDVVHGREVKNLDALANPATLDLFKNLPELLEE